MLDGLRILERTLPEMMQNDICAMSRCGYGVSLAFACIPAQGDLPMAVARPIPEEDPVTTTILLKSRDIVVVMGCCRGIHWHLEGQALSYVVREQRPRTRGGKRGVASSRRAEDKVRAGIVQSVVDSSFDIILAIY